VRIVLVAALVPGATILLGFRALQRNWATESPLRERVGRLTADLMAERIRPTQQHVEDSNDREGQAGDAPRT
jgi:hypothetical protein